MIKINTMQNADSYSSELLQRIFKPEYLSVQDSKHLSRLLTHVSSNQDQLNDDTIKNVLGHL